MRLFLALCAALSLGPQEPQTPPPQASSESAAGRWKLQYFYDQEKTALTINDFAFPTAQIGLGVGFIAEGKHEEPTEVLTTDGGEHWAASSLKETPVSLFFLDDHNGWMVTTKGLWRTTDSGRNWSKLPKPPGDLLRVCFTSEQNGFAVGIKKLVIETHDGAQTWKVVKDAEDQPGDPKYSAYVWVAFANPKIGLIAGTNIPPRRFAPFYPDWLDPEATFRMKDIPHLSYSLVTLDGGETWLKKTTTLLGQTARFRLYPNGKGLGLIEYSELSEIPSEVYLMDWHQSRTSSIYKDKSISVSDISMDADGTVYLSGVQEPGRLRDIIPGKVVVLKSRDYKNWEKMPVDYRASAIHTMLAEPDPEHRFLATDNGMILKWTGR